MRQIAIYITPISRNLNCTFFDVQWGCELARVKKLCFHTATTGMNIEISQNYSVQCAHLENTEMLCNQPPSHNSLHADRDAGYVCITRGVRVWTPEFLSTPFSHTWQGHMCYLVLPSRILKWCPSRRGGGLNPNALGTSHMLTILLVPNLPLTSKQKFSFSMRPIY